MNIRHTLYRYIAKPIFFQFDPELVHDTISLTGRVLGAMAVTRFIVRKLLAYKNPILEQTILGLHFANPVGLSEGFDKEGQLFHLMGDVGFGFTQVGSVTQDPYGGNPKPRLTRLKKSKAIVVYYGLKSTGAPSVVRKMKKRWPVAIPVGVSIAKTNCVRNANQLAAIEDYCAGLETFRTAGIGNFYTLNISCPNAFGGEPFTTPESLAALLEAVKKMNMKQPIFIKMPIDLSWLEFQPLLDVIMAGDCQGVIIGNLTKDRTVSVIKDAVPLELKGGISGLPTQAKSNDLIGQTYNYCGERLVIVGVGGIFSAADAYEKIKRGASLVQLITGMIYEGPQLIGDINRGLVQLLKNDGYSSISQAVGVYHRSSSN